MRRDHDPRPVRALPNAYKMLMTHMTLQGISHREEDGILPCFAREYETDGVCFMNVATAAG